MPIKMNKLIMAMRFARKRNQASLPREDDFSTLIVLVGLLDQAKPEVSRPIS